MIAVDDGLMSGHLDLADTFFLIAVIVGVVAGIARLSADARKQQFGAAMTAIALAAVAFALLAL